MALINISPAVLRKETLDILKQVDKEISEIQEWREAQADRLGAGRPELVAAVSVRMATLLQAKATAYNTLVLLQNK